MMTLFDSFQQERPASRETCEKYSAILPAELTDAWQRYGFGSLLDGYLRMVDPADYQDLLADTYFRGDVSVPIFVTAFADIVIWERGRYLRLVNYKDGVFQGIAAGFGFFWEDLASGAFDTRFFERPLYQDAVRRLGGLAFDESFGYVPLLALGGSRGSEHLQKVKTREHIQLIAQAAGRIGG